MVLIPILLCLATLPKLAAIANAIRWLVTDGARYRKYLVQFPPETVAQLEARLQIFNADFFPFGLKDYRLGRYMRNLPQNSARYTATWWILVVFQKVFFQFQGLAFASAAFLVLAGHAPRAVTGVPPTLYGGMGAALGTLLMIGIILLTAESFISYVVLGSYGSAFHHLDVRRQPILGQDVTSVAPLTQPEGQSLAITEMKAFMGIYLTGFAIMAAATYFISMQLGGFAALADQIPPGLIDWRRLFDTLYCTVNIVAGSSEANPVTMLAMLVGMIGTVAYVTLSVVVLAALASIAIRTPD